MNLLCLLLLPMWQCFLSLLSLVILARTTPVSTVSSFSSQMEAVSPGMAVIKVVHHQDLNKRILVTLIVASTLLCGILLFLLYFWICRHKIMKNSNGEAKRNLEPTKTLSLSPIVDQFNSLPMASKKGSVAVIEYRLLEAATNNFRESNVLGQGGRGRVYKACFDGKFLAAVKKLDGGGHNVEREFENEVDWMIKIQHQNIVSLLGYCIHGESKLLVYEMMQNGSLESQLHGPTRGSALTWQLRMKIAIDVARALEYLHEHCNPPVIHRDIKSSNILLDSNFNAKLSDFGLTVVTGSQNKNVKLSGTLGYVAPEYLLEGKLTDKSDVYAFGIVLLELLVGKKPLEQMSPSRCQSIATWAMPQLTNRLELPNIVDPLIRDTMDLKHLYQVAAVAVLCIQPEPSYRPLITDVLHSLIPLVPMELRGSLRVT
ncbi:probable receptor-like protein kinase At1g80640 [Gossypium arboreum]|uniref:probable receptor-like protein kinase At1g80640 n=1 Tax=Gossypium arboreum TaxID=29729 RepID=UPI0008194087|nr:probable receptor-like protein kinase At1g80640 [Gossypium arboreum]